MDDPTVTWQKDRYDKILTSLKSFLELMGYEPDNDCTFIPVSGLKGINIDKGA
jgi:peptide chain release factor subunit 3